MNETGFCHLHTHSEYSVLDGAAKLKELLLTARELGQTSIAITDHGSTSGLWEAQKLSAEIGVKVIHACEFYYQRENDGKNGHLVVLAKNDKGLENIFRMQHIACVHNFYYKPRINWEILSKHSEGLIVTSSCLGSTFNQHLMKGEVLEATEWARKFKSLFGDDFYIEIQANALPEQYIVNLSAIRIAQQLSIELIATNDVHYTFESDSFVHEVLLAMQMGKKMDDEKRFKFGANDFWLKSEDEMWESFSAFPTDVIHKAFTNTALIADRCSAEIKVSKHLPQYYSLPKGADETKMLEEIVYSAAEERGHIDNEPYMQDVEKEIKVISEEGYAGYFLIVKDYIESARENGVIVGDGRGSAAGSKVAYLTDISKIEPSEYDLLFERFLATGREPDIDSDFSDQDAVFADLQQKYGEENVARIIAFGTLTAKSVTRKVFSAFGHEMPYINSICKLIGDEVGVTIASALSSSIELQQVKTKHSTEFSVIERLEGIVSHESMHAGGVIICKGMTSILPVKSKAPLRSKLIAAWDMEMLHEVGQTKFDILGLETLPIIKRTLESIKRSTGEEIDLDAIDWEDEETYNLLCTGDVSGIFQINNQSAKVMEQQPRSFRDLIAINALIRP